MSKVRTIIMLSQLERIRLQCRAREDKVSVAEVVRRAVDRYIKAQQRRQVAGATN